MRMRLLWLPIMLCLVHLQSAQAQPEAARDAFWQVSSVQRLPSTED